MSSLDKVDEAFLRVRSSALRVLEGDAGAKEQAYQDIFALNNEIGRLARERRGWMAKMKELQAFVNMITVGIKYDRAGDLREGLAVTERSIGSLKRDPPDWS